jgi:hypothetical protein
MFLSVSSSTKGELSPYYIKGAQPPAYVQFNRKIFYLQKCFYLLVVPFAEVDEAEVDGAEVGR